MAEIAVPDKFHLPFYKLQLSQLNCAARSGSEEWIVRLDSGKEIPCFMVWLQGKVDFISSDRENIQLSDGRGNKVRLLQLSGTPGNVLFSLTFSQLIISGGSKWVCPGQYIQVIGQVTDLVSGVAQVKCTKLTDLSNNKHAQQMWDLEVAELHNLLSGRIVFRDL